MFQRATDIAKLALLSVTIALGASILTRLDNPIEVRIPSSDVLLFRQAIGPGGDPGLIGEQITVGKDGAIVSKHGK